MVNFENRKVDNEMKKFYEKPVVEITKFAFEDIMTVSVTVNDVATEENAAGVINEIEARAAATGANVQAKRYSLYKW